MSVSLLLAALTAALSPPPTPSKPAIVAERFGLYVVTDDLDRASTFYTRLFGAPQVRVPGMVGFDVVGGLYAVVDRKAFGVVAVRGDTTRGYIKVADIHASHRAVAAMAPVAVDAGVTAEGSFSFFRVRDPDGNVIEFYAIAPR